MLVVRTRPWATTPRRATSILSGRIGTATTRCWRHCCQGVRTVQRHGGPYFGGDNEGGCGRATSVPLQTDAWTVGAKEVAADYRLGVDVAMN